MAEYVTKPRKMEPLSFDELVKGWPYLQQKLEEKREENVSLQGWAQWSLGMMKVLMDMAKLDIESDPELANVKRRLEIMKKVVAQAEEEATLPAPNVAVVMEGGLVQCVVSDAPERLPDMRLMVIDYDTDGADESELVEVPLADGSTSEALAHVDCVSEATIDLESVAKVLF